MGEGDIEAFVAEIAALLRDEEADIAGRVQHRHIHPVSSLRANAEQQPDTGRKNNTNRMVAHDVSSRHALAA